MSLTYAKLARRKRAAALGKVATGAWPLRQVLRQRPETLKTCPLWRVLLCAPRMGTAKVRYTIERAHVYPLLALGDLTDSEIERVVEHLPKGVE